ncbi:hypothetical protein BCR42DRAFT_438107 [Absidia repens]|uniref:Fragile site-associated protein C-terminal domain-containing protein n=1 Tax=Absidia repens TaxID=90262 RepID=A0A1X2IG62_9FUNG|nr:hypothetical protein BCR42DRAFT_438107 [Absidia repens]
MTFYSNVESIATHSANSADLWTFIICCLVVIIVILFFLFYFNRLVARLFTLVANQYLWRRHGAYIQLGARILFRNFQYHSTDLSFSVVKGHITLQYWLFNVQKSNSFTNDDTKLPCRLVCSVEGFEGFVYNNIPFYERMKAILGLETEPASPQRPMDPFTINGSAPNAHDPENQALSDSSLLQRLLPIQIECTTAAIIIGNSQLPSYIVMKTSQASGTLSTAQPRSSLDCYKLTLNLILRKPQVSMEQNEHYTKEKHQHVDRVRPQQSTFSWWKGICMRNIKDHQYEEQQQYTYDEPHCRQSYREDYAKIESIVECSQIALCYYADIPGPVPNIAANGYPGVGLDIGNGGLPPEWGVQFSLWNAVINYGPWADKQRLPLQNYFIPHSHRNNKPTTRLSPGDIRIPTSFEFLVDFMTDAKLRIPTKEVSKNWKYTGDVPNLDTDKDGYYIRPYGWFDVKFKEGSNLKAGAPLVTSKDGYLINVDVELKDADVTTSVNFANLVHVDGFKLHVNMPFPVVWNEHRIWSVDAKATNPELFLLRDHVFLLQDLVRDWIAHPPLDLLHFVPVTYQLRLETNKASVFLCINEHNIINYPNSIDDNAFAAIYINKVAFNISVPMITYQPEVVSVNYEAQLDNVHGGVSLQSSHTWSSFMRKEDAELGSCQSILIQGSYEAYTTVDVLRHIESASLHIKFHGAVLKLFGAVIRYIMILRDNYIGNSLHFCTIDEYRQRRSNPDDYMRMRKKEMDSKSLSDPFELYLLCDVDDCSLILPENLYECSHYSQLEFRELQLELRNLDIYMDMYVTFSPITWTRESNRDPTTRHRHSKMKNARDPGNYLYIDGANIHAHRLFGPHPATSTYLCHWELDVGNVKGELKPSFLMGLSSFCKTFVYNLIDEDNMVSLNSTSQTSCPDVTFASAQVRQVEIYLMTQNSSTQLHLQNGLRLDFDNLINEKYNQRIGLQLPAITVTCLANQDEGDQQQSKEHTWVEVARIESGINVTFFRHKKEWKKHRAAQQNFIRLQDQLTGRCTHLYDDEGTMKGAPTTTQFANERHVGVVYAPLFGPYSTQNYSGAKNQPSTLDDRRSSLSDDDIDDDGENFSMISFNDQWPIISDSVNSEGNHLRHYGGNGSMESLISNNDSFCTAESEDDFYTSVNLANVEETSNKTFSEVDVEDEYDYSDMTATENTGQAGYTVTSIPPSIPYSGYLNRFAVKRAAHSPGFDRQDTEFNNYNGDFFTGFQDETNTNLPLNEDCINGDDKRNDVVTTSVLEATRSVKILVTPILIKVVQEVTEIINKDDWDLETMLDSSQMEYVGQLTRYLTDKFICTRFALWLPSTHLHFIQNVMIPADLPTYKQTQSHLHTLYDNQNDMLCAADIFLDDFQMIGGMTFQDYAFGLKQKSVTESNLMLEESRVHMDIGNMGCKVQYVSDCYENRRYVMFGIPSSRQYVHGRNLRRNFNYCDSDKPDNPLHQTQSTNELVVLDLGLNKLSCKWLGARKPNYLDFDVNELSAIIITESVEILLGAAYSWLVFVDDLQRIIERFQYWRSRQNQVFIHELAKFSNDDTSASRDPQFLTIPTSMGLRIGSKNFRNDVGWKLLARMRQCLRLMPLTVREKLQYRLTSGGAIEHMDPTALYEQVIQAFSDWRSWEIHSGDIRSCRLFTRIFNQHEALQRHNHGMSAADIGVALDVEEDDDDDHDTTDSNLKDPPEIATDDMTTFLMTSTNNAAIKINRFDFCIYDEEPDIDDNHIIVGPLEFSADTIYKLSELGNSTKDPATSFPTSEGYLDAVAKLDIGLIEVSVNPTVLAFARHMLTVQWVFTNKLKNLSNTSPTRFGTDCAAAYTMNQLPTPANDQQPSFDINLTLSRIDVVAHALVRIQQIRLGAWAQKLTMKSNIHSLRGSMVFSNPRLSHVTKRQSQSEKDSDTNNSGKPSSSRTSRKQGSQPSRIIMNASGGIDSLDVGFYELLSSTSAPMDSYNDNSSNIYGGRRQILKRIHTKLLVLTVLDAKINANISQPSKPNKKQRPAMKNSSNREILKIFSSVGAFDMDAPQSLLRLYSFIEEWRSEQGQRYHFMFQNLLNEWEEQRRLTDQEVSANQHYVNSGVELQQSSLPGRWYDIKLQFLLVKFDVKADLLRSLSIKFSIDDFLVLVDETQEQTTVPAPKINYAIQLSKQVVEFITRAGNNDNIITNLTPPANLSHPNAFNLPGIRSSGSLIRVLEPSLGKYGYQLQSSISVDFIAMSLDVSVVDSLLTAHSLLGNEINEIIEAFSYSRKNQNQPASPSAILPSSTSVPPFKYAIGFSLDGLRIKAASPTATGLFESNVLEASISNHSSLVPNQQFIWNVSGSNFALSLDHGVPPVTSLQTDDDLDGCKRSDRLAYIVVDFGLRNKPMYDDGNTTDQLLGSYEIRITKIQAVMQPIALGKLIEMYIYYDSELKKKKEIKREEIERLAANTKRIVESLQADTAINEQDIHVLLQGRQLSLVVENLGVAIPLSDLTEISPSPLSQPTLAENGNDQQQQYRSQHHHHRHAALLFTFSSLQFTTKKFTTTTATIDNISLQFVKRFDQSNESHFFEINHPRMNQLRLPSIRCIVGTMFESKSRKLNVHIDAKARGFELDLDGTIVDYLNRLAVIYDQGMDRVNAFDWEIDDDAPVNNKPETNQPYSSTFEWVHLDVEGLFEYGASVVRLYPRRQTGLPGRKQGKTTARRSTRRHGVGDARDDDERGMHEGFGIATIKLPGLNAGLKYQTPLGVSANLSDSPQRFHTDILIRESSNVLHPSLVQFLGEAVSGLKFGMQLSTERKVAAVPTPSWKHPPSNISASIFLRLSKTKLDLSCQPASKVVCSLGWSKSEFVVNSFSDGTARTTSCFGSLRNISTVVKHHFSPQSCLTANVDLVEFNASLTPKSGDTQECDNISLIVKIPSIQGDISMRHLQDLLILNSCWFAQSISHSHWRQQQQQWGIGKQCSGTTMFSSYLTLVLDKMVFSVDMGQAIGNVQVVPWKLALQTHTIPGVSQGIDLSLDEISITSEGRLTGETKLYGIVLHGKINTSTLDQQETSSQLYLELDGLRAKFTYEYQNILELLQEPIRVTATSNSKSPLKQQNSYLHHQLKLTLHLGRSIATLSVKTVPVIIVMHQRFMELLEKKQNEARAVYFLWMDMTKNIVDDQPSSQSLLTAPSTTCLNKLSIASIDQQRPHSMAEIYVEGIQLIVYPSQFQDGDNLEIHAMQVEGSLQQTPKSNNEGIHRHLHLGISRATLLKNVPGQEIMENRLQQLDHILISKRKQTVDYNDIPIDMEESVQQSDNNIPPSKEMGTSIFTLPVTKLDMDSTQVLRTVEHTFIVDFEDRVQLSLHIGQLKYLQDLVSTFIDQMARAMKTVDSTSISRTSSAVEQHQEERDHGDDATSLDSGIGVGDLIIGQQQQQQQMLQQQQKQQPLKCTATIEDDNGTMETSTNRLIYLTDTIIQFNPQIRQMGDATPPVEWVLGLRRHRIPELVHENLTLHIDQVVQMIWDIYCAHVDGT